MSAFIGGRIHFLTDSTIVKKAAHQFQSAYDGAAKLPSFEEGARLNLKQKLAFTSIRLGDGPKAEKLFRELIAAYTSYRNDCPF